MFVSMYDVWGGVSSPQFGVSHCGEYLLSFCSFLEIIPALRFCLAYGIVEGISDRNKLISGQDSASIFPLPPSSVHDFPLLVYLSIPPWLGSNHGFLLRYV